MCACASRRPKEPTETKKRAGGARWSVGGIDGGDGDVLDVGSSPKRLGKHREVWDGLVKSSGSSLCHQLDGGVAKLERRWWW